MRINKRSIRKILHAKTLPLYTGEYNDPFIKNKVQLLFNFLVNGKNILLEAGGLHDLKNWSWI